MCACDDSVSRTEKFRRSIDGLKAWCAYRLPCQKFCAQNDVFLGVRVSFVLCLTLDKQIGMCPPPAIQAIHCWAWLFSTLKENKSAYGCLLAAPPHKQKIPFKEYGYLIRIDDTPKLFENSKVSKDWLRGSSLTLQKREFATKAAFKKLFLLEPPCCRQDEKEKL